MTAPVRPPALAPGARVHVVAPSGPVDPGRLETGLRVLQRHLDLDLVLAPNLDAKVGYLAGDDAVRLEALQTALADPDAAAIFCARGGYGATRLLPALDPERLRRSPKMLVGFSDVSALLLWALARANVASIHGPVLTQLGSLHEDDVQRLLDLLGGRELGILAAEEGAAYGGGHVEGRLVAANLEVLRSLIGTRAMPSLEGTILAIEEIGERPYRIDRALTQLLQSGRLRGVRGIAVGQLIGCEEPDGQGPSALDVVLSRLQTLGVPIVTGFPFGHDRTHNAALPVGGLVHLDGENCCLEFLEPAATDPRAWH